MTVDHLLFTFVPQLATGMVMNFKIAAIAIVLGLALGVPLTYARLGARAAAGEPAAGQVDAGAATPC